MFAALAAIRAAQQLGLPLVHTMHGRIDVYTANVLPLPALTTHLLAYLHGRHVPRDGIEVGHDSPYTRTAQARTMWRLMLAQSRASDHVIVPSAHFREKLVAQGINTPTTVLSNTLHASVRERIGDPAPRVLRQGEPLRMLWVGRLSPEKRPATFAHAARTLGSAALADMYGEGLGRRAVERIGGPVTLHGSVPQDRVLAAMRDAHVLVSTSYDFDNQPMVMLEALASGLPIVYCDPDLAEVVTPDAGALTPSPDADGLVATVRELLAEPGRISRMSEAALAARDSVFAGIAPLVQVYEAVSRS